MIHHVVFLVLLAPYGLNAHLTGHSIPDTDARSSKILQEWGKFFPVDDISAKLNKDATSKSAADALPMVVEVTLGEVKMLYPSRLVLIPVISTKSMGLNLLSRPF